MKKFLVALGLAVLLSAALWLPAGAQSEGTVTATVTVQEIAVSVSPASINYEVVPFETSRRSDALTTPVTFTASNDGNVNIDLKVRGLDATVTGGPWAIQAAALDCLTPVLNTYRHSVIGVPGNTPTIFMTTTNSSSNLVSGLASAVTKQFNSEIFTPCSGSAGVGATATTSITVVALASP